MLKHCQEQGVALVSLAHQIHTDQGLSGKVEVELCLPDVHCILDLKQELGKIKEAKISCSERLREWVFCHLQFAVHALHWSRALFHLYVEAMMGKLADLHEYVLISYLEQDVFPKGSDDMWTCRSWTHCSSTRMDVKRQSDEVACLQC